MGFRWTRIVWGLCLLAAVAAPASAHHGRDFLLVRTAELPHRGQVFLVPRQDWIDTGDGQEFEFEPSLLVALHDRLALEAHGHFAGPALGELEYESIAPGVAWRLSDPNSNWGVALAAEYEFAANADEPDVQEVGQEAGHHNESGSEHSHAADRLEVRFAISRRLGVWLVAGNLIVAASRAGVEDAELGYALGARRPLAGRTKLGLEAMGSFEENAHELLLGLYSDLAMRLTLSLGAGIGLGPEGSDLSVRTAIVVRLW
jgi:hypothetical protein